MIHDDESGIHRRARVRSIRNLDGVGMAAQVSVSFINCDPVVPGQIVCGSQSGHPGPHDGNILSRSSWFFRHLFFLPCG